VRESETRIKVEAELLVRSKREVDVEILDVLDFLDTWVAGGLGLGGLGLPQAPQSPCEFVSVGHVWTPISSSACFVSNRL
jgi:hypothetical protein